MLEIVTQYAEPVITGLAYLIAGASALAALTPTPRDDELLGKGYKVIEWVALNFGYAKDLPPNQ